MLFLKMVKKTVYCPNPGSMLGLTEKNTKIWLRNLKIKNQNIITFGD